MTNLVSTFAPTSLSEATEFSKMLAQSDMVPRNFKNKPADILVAIQWGYELNLQPLQALQNISVINGKPSVWGDVCVALVKSHPHFRGLEETATLDEATCTIKRQVGDQIEVTTRTFTKDDARIAGLLNKQGPWKQYPKRMMQMRARGFALRDAFPDALKGVITTEEAMDYPEVKDITPMEKVEQTVEKVKEHFPNARVIDQKPHGTFLEEHREIWQSITTADLMELARKDKSQIGEVLKRWREEAVAVFRLTQTKQDYIDTERRYMRELEEIRNVGKGGAGWADKCFAELSKELTEIADRIADKEAQMPDFVEDAEVTL